MANKYDKFIDTPFTPEELDQIRQDLFYRLIPKIQRHVDETGHIWTLRSSCHDCLSLRYEYQDAIGILSLSELKSNATSTEIIDMVYRNREYSDSTNRRLSD